MTEPMFDETGRPRLDLQASRQARDAGIAAVVARTDDAADAYRAAYRAEFRRQVAAGSPFTSESIRAVVGDPPAGCSPNLIGGLFAGLIRTAKQTGQVVEVGYVQMASVRSHARRTPAYRGT